jgi:hypothetical protein
MKFAQGLGLALAFLHDVRSQIFIKSRISPQPKSLFLNYKLRSWSQKLHKSITYSIVNGVQR